MKKILKVLGIVSLLIITASQANAGIFSKFRGWSNNFWNNGWGSGRYYNNYNCPYHNHYNSSPHYHGNGFFHSGSMTGFTPPINGSFYPSIGNYHSPMYPGHINSINSIPQQVITDFNSNVGTRTGVTILD